MRSSEADSKQTKGD